MQHLLSGFLSLELIGSQAVFIFFINLKYIFLINIYCEIEDAAVKPATFMKAVQKN